MVILALGIPAGGSVTRRRPLGTTALIMTGLFAIVDAIPWDDVSQWPLPVAEVFFYGQLLLKLVAVIIAVTAIARSSAVPAPWNWAPTWCLVALAVPSILLQGMAATNPANLQQSAEWISALTVLVSLAVPIFLGALAIALAQRPAIREPVSIYSSGR